MRTHPRTTLILPAALLALLALCGMALASRARAGEVHFDPESPAGKEYALPLQQARNEALGAGGGEATPGGGGGGSAGAGATAPLFGIGVSGKGGGSGPGDEGAARSGGESKAEGQGQRPAGEDTSQGRSSGGGATTAAASASYSDSQGLLLLAGILILGALIGLGLRAFARQRPATP